MKKAREKLAGREKEKGREPAPAFPSFLPFYFRVCAFLIQRTRLSRSLEQARWGEEKIVFFPACRARSRARVKARPNPRGKKTSVDRLMNSGIFWTASTACGLGDVIAERILAIARIMKTKITVSESFITQRIFWSTFCFFFEFFCALFN